MVTIANKISLLDCFNHKYPNENLTNKSLAFCINPMSDVWTASLGVRPVDARILFTGMPQIGGFSPDIEGFGLGFIKKPAPASAKAGFFSFRPRSALWRLQQVFGQQVHVVAQVLWLWRTQSLALGRKQVPTALLCRCRALDHVVQEQLHAGLRWQRL